MPTATNSSVVSVPVLSNKHTSTYNANRHHSKKSCEKDHHDGGGNPSSCCSYYYYLLVVVVILTLPAIGTRNGSVQKICSLINVTSALLTAKAICMGSSGGITLVTIKTQWRRS